MREALRGHEHESFVCGQVEQVIMGADPETDTDTELSELADVMHRLRRDALEAQARQLAERVALGDASAMNEYKRVRDQLQTLIAGSTA